MKILNCLKFNGKMWLLGLTGAALFVSFSFSPFQNGYAASPKGQVKGKKKKKKKEYSNAKNFSNYSKRKDGLRRSYPSKAKRIGKGAHPEALDIADLPKDKFGLVDWAASVRQSKISPLATLEPEEMPQEEFLEKQMILTTAITFNDVVFPHDIHSYWLKCDTCHDQIFVKKRGANQITMFKNKSGLYCGRCHGKVAFPLEDCDRCHVLPKANFPY